MSHSYITSDTSGDPHRPTHQEIIEEEQVRAYRVVDVLPRCHRIMELEKAGIDKKNPYDSEVRDVLEAIIKEARETLQCRR